MAVEISCSNPSCKKLLIFGDEAGGRMTKCLHCHTPVYVPHLSEIPLHEPSFVHPPSSGNYLRWIVVAAVATIGLAVVVGLGTVVYFFWPGTRPNSSNPGTSSKVMAVGGTFETAHVLSSISPTGSATQKAAFTEPKQIHMFRLQAPIAGTMIVQLDGAGATPLDVELVAYADDRKELIANDASADKRVNQVLFEVAAGSSYFIKATGLGNGQGDYTLTASTVVDIGSTPSTAHLIPLSRTGYAKQAWRIKRPGDEHMFRVAAPRSGIMSIRMQAIAGSKLDSLLDVYDDAQKLLDRNDDEGDGTRDSRVEFPVSAGKTYYVRSSAFGDPKNTDEKVGGYSLTFNIVDGTDDFGNSHITAQEIRLAPVTQQGRQEGKIDYDFDHDFFYVIAPTTGTMMVRMEAIAGSDLIPFFRVSETQATGTNLGVFKDYAEANPLTKICSKTIPVARGLRYNIEARNSIKPIPAGRTGGYRLTIEFSLTLDLPGNNFLNAKLLTLRNDGSGEQLGRIDVEGAEDFYRFTAPATGQMTIRLEKGALSSLDPHLYVYDDRTDRIAENDDIDYNGGDLNSQVSIRVVAGRTYYVKAAVSVSAAADRKKGSYRLLFKTGN